MSCFSGNSLSMQIRTTVLQVVPISWEQGDQDSALPLKVWARHDGFLLSNSVWLSLRWDVFERLYQ